MKRTHEEEVLHKLSKIGKKNKFYKLLMVICSSVVLGYFSFLKVIVGNTKKIVSLFSLLLFFSVGSSFAPIGLVRTTEEVFTGMEVPSGAETADGLETAISGNEPAMPDEDIIDGYEEGSAWEEISTDMYSADEILETKEAIDGRISAEEELTVKGTTVFDKTDWNLLLINKQHPIPEDYAFELGTIKGSMQCDRRIIEDLLAMLQGAKGDGVNLAICSPYRDLNRQESLFNRKIKAYMKNGMSYMEAYKISSQAVTVPGASEHQVGLAIDLISDKYYALNAGFGDTEAGKWLAAHCGEYGFILRYPRGKEYITSIEYEPWHFRYVGKEAAAVIMEQGITLEEFVEGL